MNGEEYGEQGHTDHTPPAIVDTLYDIEISKLAAHLERTTFTVTADKDTNKAR